MKHAVCIGDNDIEIGPIVEHCETEIGADAVNANVGDTWSVDLAADWTWAVDGTFYFNNEDEATGFALKFL